MVEGKLPKGVKKEDITEFFESRNQGCTYGLVDEMTYDLEDDKDELGYTSQNYIDMENDEALYEDHFDPEIFEKEMGEAKKPILQYGITVPPEFSHVLKILQTGVDKGYKANGWLNDPESSRMSHKENHDSMFHHLSESFAGIKKDKDSGLHPLLHLATRALMGYTREMRGIESERD